MFGSSIKKINSSALGYAISFMLLIGLICSGVLFVSSVNKRIELNFTIQEHLLFDNYFSLIYGAKLENTDHQFLYHPSGDTSELILKPWGAFRIVCSATRHKLRQVNKSALIGFQHADKLPALYLVDNDQALKLCGDTKIEGDAYLSERGLERAYIAGKNYTNELLLYGDQKKSEKALPPLKDEIKNLSLESYLKNTLKLDDLPMDSAFSFTTETRLYSKIEAIHLRQKLSGNLIVHSFDSIFVSAEANLENVILIAPIIRFEKGFSGSLQAIAHRQISLETEVSLNYPSTLTLNELTTSANGIQSGIKIEEKAKILGGILITSQNYNFRLPPSLFIAKDALVGGLIYNSGESSVYGKIIGHLYTQQFRIQAGGGVYLNYLLDAQISSKKLPAYFLLPSWLKSMKPSASKIISCF